MFNIKDPDAVLDYSFDWTAYLGTDTIASSVWIIPPGLVYKTDSFTTTGTVVWLAGGTPGQVYTITNRITTAGGRSDDRSRVISVRNL